MPVSILLNLGNGNLQSGFPRITATLWSTEHPHPEQWLGGLPPAPHLLTLYREWQTIYQSLCNRILFRSVAIDEDEFEIEASDITNISQKSFEENCQQLQAAMNHWLGSEEFRLLSRSLRSRLESSAEIRVIIETNEPVLRRLPWQQWDFFEHYPNAELALSQPEYQRRGAVRPKHLPKKVRILAILGDCFGIDVGAEMRFLKRLQDADVTFLVNPSYDDFHNQLWRSSGWDILFFAGHSKTEGETGRIYLNDKTSNNSLTLDQLKIALQSAINRGLKLAIFNSCDGLGLALALERLHIPAVIVMREAVPNHVAQQFFDQFLEAFAIERLPLYVAVRQARQQLQGLEAEFPGASWLPVICQNPAAGTPNWLQLGGMPSCPYRGLSAFREEDAHLFFGREQVTQRLVMAVQHKSLVCVVGASGSGKSSIVLAGLIPQLRKYSQAQNPAALWQIIVFRPGSNPFKAFTEVVMPLSKHLHLGGLADQTLIRLESTLRSCANGLTQLINDITKSIFTEGAQKLVLVIDQFEELYTQTLGADCQLFLRQLLDAIRECPGLTLVLTLRADFYGYALSYRPLSDALQGAVYNLGPMNREELQSAIECPADTMKVKLEKGLTEKLIEATWDHPGRLPLLEFALTQLWSKQYNGWLTHEAYSEIGGVERALANHAETVYEQLSTVDRARARRIFAQLVRPGVGIDTSRRLATRDEVGEENWDLVSFLASARLVVTNRHELTGEETVEVVHEALLKSWRRLEQWIELDYTFRNWQEDLRITMRRWESSAQDEGALLRGKLLADAEFWYSNRKASLGSKEQQFIQLSLWQRDQQLKQRKHRRQFLLSSLTLGFLFTLSLAGFAVRGWQASAINEVKSTVAFSEALFASEKQFDALIESVRAKKKVRRLIGIDPELQAQTLKVLQQSVYRVVEINRLPPGENSRVWSVAISPDSRLIAAASNDQAVHLWSADGQKLEPLKGHTDWVWGVAFSPDNQIIASGGEDRTVRLWTRDGRQLHILEGHQDAVWAVAISPDSQTIASGSNDGTIRLWSRNGEALQILTGYNSPVWGIAFSPDGQLIGSTSEDGTVKLWTRTGQELNSFKAHSKRVASIAFSPNSQQIATASDDGSVKLWSPEGRKLATLSAHNGAVWRVAFSPNGKLIATASWDETIKLWSTNGELLTTLGGHTSRVRGVDFSQDSQMLVSGGEDSIVRLWKLNNTLLKVLAGHTNAVIGATFSPNSQWITSASDDGSVKIWDRKGRLLNTLTHPSGVLSVAISPDSQKMVTAASDGSLSLWTLDGTLLRTFKAHDMLIWHVVFSPDGQTIVSASADQTVKLWTLAGTLLQTLKAHDSEVREVKFSPDGQLIASASMDGSIGLWTLNGTLLKTFSAHEGGVAGLDFSPDGQKIASGGFDQLVKLWALDGTPLMTLRGHQQGVRGLAFSPNNQLIASASADGTVRLWETNGDLLNTLKGHSRAVWKVAFSPDGQTLASTGEDKTLILWNVSRVRSLDPLAFACHWLHDYLRTSPSLSQQDRTLCN